MNNILERSTSNYKRFPAGLNIWILLVFFLGGCSTLPELKVGYRHSDVGAEITMTQSVLCVEVPGSMAGGYSDWQVFRAIDTQFNQTFTAAADVNYIDLSRLSSAITAADVDVNFYDDGRLKGINSTFTGDAEKFLVALSKPLSALAGIAAVASPRVAIHNQCKQLQAIAKDSKNGVFTLIVKGFTDFHSSKLGVLNSIAFTAQNLDQSTFLSMPYIFGQARGSFDKITLVATPKKSHKFNVSNYKGEKLVFRQPAPLLLTFEAVVQTKAGPSQQIDHRTTEVMAPQYGSTYDLPIPKKPWFGVNTMALAVSPAGIPTQVKYGGGGNATSVLNTLTGVRDNFKSKSPAVADQVAETKAQADLIQQQQRLIKCQADPKNC